MRRARARGSEFAEDATEQAGWMYADLFLGLMVIFLATISFVPTITPEKNTAEKPKSELNSMKLDDGLVKLYSTFIPEEVKADIEKYLTDKNQDLNSTVLYVQLTGGYDPKIENSSVGVANAVQFGVEMKQKAPELFAGVSFTISTSTGVPSQTVGVRMALAPGATK
jgi:hypothetical protein